MARFYTFSRGVLKGLFSLLYGHEVILPEKELYPGPAIIAANHASFLDPPLIAASLQEEIVFLAGSHLFENVFLRKLITNLNAYPVSNNTSDIATLRMICNLLKQGKKVLIFPEGARTDDGTLSPFKNGLGLLSKKTGCPVIPTYIEGTYAAWPKSKRVPTLLGQKTRCIFGNPIFFTEEDQKKQDTIAIKTYTAILQLQQIHN